MVSTYKGKKETNFNIFLINLCKFVIFQMKRKFSDREKVLCYEPDSTKARVLYDATVVEREIKENGEIS